MKTFLAHLLEKFRGSIWTIPALLSLGTSLLAFVLLKIDHALTWKTHYWLDWVDVSSPEGARALLSTIATSMLAVAGVSFSSIMVVMALASQQFGPRLLRNFIKDKFNQTVLGTLIATFIYCIFILRSVRSSPEYPFVPQLATLSALILAVICLALFIRFIHQVMTGIGVERVIADAHSLLEKTIIEVFPGPDDAPQEYRISDNEHDGWKIVAGRTGYIQAISFENLVEVAKKHDAILATQVKAGCFVSDRQAIVTVVEGPTAEEAGDSFREEIKDAFFIGPDGSPEQDFEYGVRQLVEVALRALSPGINDPYTAMTCIDYLGAGLQLAFSRPLPGSIQRDKDGNIRLFKWICTDQSLVEIALNQIRQQARDRCDVSCRLLEMLAITAGISSTKEQQEALMTQARLINEDTPPTLFNKYDRETIQERFANFTKSCYLLTPLDHA